MAALLDGVDRYAKRGISRRRPFVSRAWIWLLPALTVFLIFYVVPLGQKPDRLKLPCLGHVRAGPLLLLQSQNAQVIRHMRHGSPPRLMALQPIRVPNSGES